MEQPIVISTSDNKENEPIADEYSVDPGTSTSPEPNDTEHLNLEKHNQVSSEIMAIANDMCVRLGEHNPSYFSGVCTFIHRYKALQQRTISTPCTASALHMYTGYILVYTIML